MCEAIDCGDEFRGADRAGRGWECQVRQPARSHQRHADGGSVDARTSFSPLDVEAMGPTVFVGTSMARCVWPRFHQPLLESMLKQVSVLSKSRCPPASIRRFKRARALVRSIPISRYT